MDAECEEHQPQVSAGIITGVVGSIVDFEMAASSLPSINQALEIGGNGRRPIVQPRAGEVTP
jgi:F0F1-type ATP synthase beta subunit